MSIFPFIQIPDFTTRLGYRLRACDPLHELKIPNFDFLVVKFGEKRITLVWGDVKTSTDHTNRIIEDILRKKDTVEKNEGYIRKSYLGDTQLPIKSEYIVVVHSFFSNDIRNAIEQRGGGIIIWQADRHAHKIGFVNPGESNPHKHTMLHEDSKLNSLLSNGVITSHSFYSFFPQSHSVTKIKFLIQIVEYNKAARNKSEFTSGELDDFLYSQLSYMSDHHRIKLRNEILELGISIGFLNKRGSEVFAIKKEYAGRSSQEKVIKKIYVENHIKARRDNEIREAIELLQKKIKNEFDGKPRIDNYLER
jgi:hypothetical protein